MLHAARYHSRQLCEIERSFPHIVQAPQKHNIFKHLQWNLGRWETLKELYKDTQYFKIIWC